MTAPLNPGPPPIEPTPLSYRREEPGISRRAFRLLLLLTGINTVLLGWFVLGPQLSSFIQTQWWSYQQVHAARQRTALETAARIAFLPAQTAAFRYTAPQDTIVYRDGGTEQQRRDAQAAAATQPTGIVWPNTVPLPAPFLLFPQTIPTFGLLVDTSRQVVFLHERTAPASTEPLLIVTFLSTGGTQNGFNGRTFYPRRDFLTLTLRPATKDKPLECIAWTQWSWDPMDSSTSHSMSDVARIADMRLTVYAGQADAQDSGRINFHYDVNGVPGDIIGRVGPDKKVRLAATGPISAAWTLQQESRP